MSRVWVPPMSLVALATGYAFVVCTATGHLVASAALGPVFGLFTGYLSGYFRVRLTATPPTEGAE